jgi:dihydrofolate reductase
MNSMPKRVVSSTLSEPLEWNNSSLVEGDVPAESARLKERDGGPILVAGSATLVHSLIENALVDEYRLLVLPVVIANGKRLFPNVRNKTPLKPVEAKVFDSGALVHTLQPA